MAMRTDYQDFVPETEHKHYQQISNDDGTVSLVDQTTYLQEGDTVNAALLNELSQNAVWPLTHSKSGTVHTLTGLPSTVTGTVTVQFKATAAFKTGDKIKLSTKTSNATIMLSNGETPEDNLFVSGASVSAIIDVAGNVVNFKSGGPAKTMVTEIIAATQEWTVPKGVRSISVRLFGAGGAGGFGGGAGGHMAYGTFDVTPGTKYTVTIGAGGRVGSNYVGGSGGASSFGTLLSASGGNGSTQNQGASGGSGGGAYSGQGGDATYGGGGGAGGSSNSSANKGGNGGTYGGGGGASYTPSGNYASNTPNVSTGGTHGGNGGTDATAAKNGTNTIGKGLEFEGTGAAGTGSCAGGGGYGGVGGTGIKDYGDGQYGSNDNSQYTVGGGGGGYGSKGGNAYFGAHRTLGVRYYMNRYGGGGGGYGGDGGNGGWGGGGGGGYGKSGKGGNGGATQDNNKGGAGGIAAGGGGYGGQGGNGVCVISYMGYR